MPSKNCKSPKEKAYAAVSTEQPKKNKKGQIISWSATSDVFCFLFKFTNVKLLDPPIQCGYDIF